MRKKPFLIFSAVVAILIAAVLLFIQSRQFADIFKRIAYRQLPKDLGIEADFSGFAIKMFPPGLSLRHPTLVLREHNALGLPAGSSVHAERIDLEFRPLQMFTGNIRVHQVGIVGGSIHLLSDPMALTPHLRSPKDRSLKDLQLSFHWDELFQVHAEAISVENTLIQIDWGGADPKDRESARFAVRELHLGQWLDKSGVGYEVSMDLGRVEAGLGTAARDKDGSILRQWSALTSLEQLQLEGHVNALGAQLDTLKVRGQGLEASASGLIKGNIQNPKAGLALDAQVRASGDFAAIAKALSPGLDVAGEARFSGRVRGNLENAPDDLLESIRVEGGFEAERLRFRNFRADDFSLTGAWHPSPGGGEITIEKATVSAKDTPRAPGALSRGGKITLGAAKLQLGSSEPVSLMLTLEKARLQWLAALGITRLKQIYPVDLLASGSVPVKLQLPAHGRGFSAQLAPKLLVEDFQLDNQKPDEARPLHKIFAIPRIQLEGPVSIDGSGLQLGGVQIGVAKTQLKIAGRIDGKKGFDLHAAGPAHFEELGQIAGNDVRGEGTAAVAIHGPGSNLLVDIDLDVKNAYYLHLNLGDAVGRLTWDDDPNHLLFQKIRLTKGQSEYTLDGMLDLGKIDRIGLKADITRGNIQEFNQVFSELTQSLSWFPSSVEGPFTGELAISGGISLDTLVVAASLNGGPWEFKGERFDRVTLSGGYDKGKYHLSDFRFAKRGGWLYGHIVVDAQKTFDWDFHARQLAFGDLDHIARLDVPIRGKIVVDSTGHGKEGAIQADSKLLISDVTVRGVPMAPTSLAVNSGGGVHKVHGTALGTQGILDMIYDFNPASTSLLKAELKHLDFSPILLLLNPKSIPDPNLLGYVSGGVDLSFRAGQLERATGTAAITEYVLAKSGARFFLDSPVSMKSTNGTFDIHDLSINGNRGTATLALRGRDAKLEGKITGDLDLSIAEFLTSAVSHAVGPAALDFSIGGTIKEPTLRGQANVEGGTLWVQGLESPFENLGGTVVAKPSMIGIQDVSADLAGGRFTGDGQILLFADRYPKLNLRAALNGNKLKIYPFQYVKLSGGMTVTGEEIPYQVDGSFNVESALTTQKVLQAQKQGGGMKFTQYAPSANSKVQGDYPPFKLKLEINAPGGILVQNDLFQDTELKAHVTVINTIEAPRLLGNVDLVQGRMVFKDRSFQLQQASAVFDNPVMFAPKFNLSGTTVLNGVKVQLYAAGTIPDKFKVELSSTPVMSDTEILNLLALGTAATDNKRIMSSSDRTSVESGEAASLLLNSLDFNREVQSKTGLQIQVDEAVNNYVGTSVFRPQSPSETAVAPKIVIKKQVLKNVDVSYGSTVGVGTNSDKEVNAEVKVTPGVSVIGVWDNYETVDTQDKRTSYGLDLKLQKRFK